VLLFFEPEKGAWYFFELTTKLLEAKQEKIEVKNENNEEAYRDTVTNYFRFGAIISPVAAIKEFCREFRVHLEKVL